VNKIIPLLIKIPAALFFGCIATVTLLQNDVWLIHRVERELISALSSTLKEPLSLKVSHVYLMRAEIGLKDFSIQSSQNSWTYRCPALRAHLNWFAWLRGRGLTYTITCENPTIYSHYENGALALLEPLTRLSEAPSSMPCKLAKHVSFGAHITIDTPTMKLVTASDLIMLFGASSISLKSLASHGSLTQGNKPIFEQGAGTIEVESKPGKPITYEIKGSLKRPGSSHVYTLYYESEGDIGTGLCRADDGAFTLMAPHMVHTTQGVRGPITITGDLGKIAALLGSSTESLSGDMAFNGMLTTTQQTYAYSGDIELTQARFGGVHLPLARGAIEGDDTQTRIKLVEVAGAAVSLKGDIVATKETGEVTAKLLFSGSPLAFPSMTIERGSSTINYKEGALQAEFKGDGTFFETEQLPVRGTIITDFKTAQVRTTLGGNLLTVEADLQPLMLTKAIFKDTLHQTRLSLMKGQGDAQLEGTIDGFLCKKIFYLATGQHITGTGAVQVKTFPLHEGTRIELMVKDAALKIPGTYTLIEGLTGALELFPAQNVVLIKDLLLQFHKGTAWSSRALFSFTPEGTLSSAHMPLQCHDLLISKQKDIFGTTSGGLTFSNRKGRWNCSGIMTIENAHMRSNLLSSKVQKSLMQSSNISSAMTEIDLDITLQNRTPVKIETSFLNADAYFDLRITGTSIEPVIEGIIELSHGSFNFSYKPLLFNQGTVQLSGQYVHGPLIDLTAKNKIRMYTITMRVTGTLDQPRVVFESVPSLSEEAIMTLLLAGSEDGSISSAMPRLLMEQIEAAIFGSEEKLSAAQQFLKGIFGQLKKVRLVKKGPTQDDVHAVVEVDINDRLRAKAQNNLSLSDDTQLELAYAVSDDVTVKAVRDQEGSLGGEVEMRWKF